MITCANFDERTKLECRGEKQKRDALSMAFHRTRRLHLRVSRNYTNHVESPTNSQAPMRLSSAIDAFVEGHVWKVRT